MEIEIRLFASLRKYLPEGDRSAGIHLKVPDDATVAHVLDVLEVPREAARLVFVNSVRAQLSQLLRAGDRLGVFPPVAGG